jgi:hypothetical protein
MLLIAVLAFGFAALSVYLTTVLENCFVLFGVIPYIAIVVQIVAIFLPSYGFWFRALRHRFTLKPVPVEPMIRSFQREWLPDFTERLDATNLTRTARQTQTFTSALLISPAADLAGFSSSSSCHDLVRQEAKTKEEEKAAKEKRHEER